MRSIAIASQDQQRSVAMRRRDERGAMSLPSSRGPHEAPLSVPPLNNPPCCSLRCPLCSTLRTQVRHRAESEECQQAISTFRREKGCLTEQHGLLLFSGRKSGLDYSSFSPRRPSPIVNPALSRSLSCQRIVCFSRSAVWGFRCGASEFILTTLVAPFNYPARLLST
jgi:hypothetical protein